MLRPGSVLRLVVLATLIVPLMLFAASAAEALPHTKAVSSESYGAADPPPGTPGPFRIVNQWSGLCLDYGTSERNVYQGVCNSTDPGQRWGWFNGGWLINLARNECATDGGQYPVQVVACQDHSMMHWRHQNYAIVNGLSGYCIEAGTDSPGNWVTTQRCRTTNHQGWYVVYW